MGVYGIVGKVKGGAFVTIDVNHSEPDEEGKTGLERMKAETGLRFYPIKQASYSARLEEVAYRSEKVFTRKPRRSLRIKKAA